MILEMKVVVSQSFKFDDTWLVFKEDMIEKMILEAVVIFSQLFKLDLLLPKYM